MTVDKLRVEKTKLKDKLDELEDKYESGGIPNEEYEDCKRSYSERLKGIDAKLEEPEKRLTKAEQEYSDLEDTEIELNNELLRDSFLTFAAIIAAYEITGYLIENYLIGYALGGIIAWVMGFRLIGLSVAWGRIRAKRYEIAFKNNG